MTGAHATTTGDPALAALRALAPEIGKRDSAGVAAALAPFVAMLRSGECTADPKEAVDSVSAACRALYGSGRLAEVLPLARALLGHCERMGDTSQTRRAAGVCGLLAADTADLVGGIEYHVRSLRLAAAEENRLEMARSWGNLGAAFAASGRDELAAQCYRRCIALLGPMVQPSLVRFAAYSNLAQCAYLIGNLQEGIGFGELALRELEGIDEPDSHAVILLRRNLARLLLAAGRTEDAEEHVAQAIVLSESQPTPRGIIAADIARAAHELSCGNADVALTRMDRTLARARQLPAALHDALACAVRAEEAAGFPARALMRLQELSQHLYGHALERTFEVIKYAGLDPEEPMAQMHRDLAIERLSAKLDAPAPPPVWPALRRLAASAVLRMDDSGWHGVRVGALVKALALEWGCSPLQALELGLAAELHDIGLSSVPAAILSKAGVLNDAERTLVERHAEAGAAMIVEDPHPRMLLARDIARYHHARWDGEGYPGRVARSSIPLGARMCAIADAYDVMVCGLAGRPRRSMGESLAEIRSEAGRQFDPELVSCFAAIVNGGLEGLGLDPGSAHGMEAFQELVASLKENRGFV